MSERNKEVAKAYLKALGEGDPVLMDSVLADDFYSDDRNSGPAGGRRSREVVVDFAAAGESLFKDGLRFEYESVTAENDRVVCQVKGFSTLADGREYNNQYVFVFYIRDGKIYRLDDYYDTKLADELIFQTMEQQNIK